MGMTQRFQIRETVPGLPGERVCAAENCHAGETMDEPTGDSPAGSLVMVHTDECTETRRSAAG